MATTSQTVPTTSAPLTATTAPSTTAPAMVPISTTSVVTTYYTQFYTNPPITAPIPFTIPSTSAPIPFTIPSTSVPMPPPIQPPIQPPIPPIPFAPIPQMQPQPHQQFQNTQQIKLELFSGKNTIEAKHWLNLFEVLCIQSYIFADQGKVAKLMSYLSEEALAFFAQRIAPNITTITWAETRALIEKRFGTPEVSAIVASGHRRLRKTESVKEYFDGKMKLLDKTSLTEPEKCDVLTDGVYDEFKKYLITAIITSTEDWLQRALRVELSLNRKPFNSDSHFKQHFKNKTEHNSFQLNANTGKNTRSNQLAPYPCRYCQDHGKEEYHWHSECPIKANLRPSRGNYSPGQQQVHHSSEQINPNETIPKVIDTSSPGPTEGCGILVPSLHEKTNPPQITTTLTHQDLDANYFATQQSPETEMRLLDVDVNLDGIPVKAIVDTGSTISVASQQTFESLNKQFIPNTAMGLNQVSGKTSTKGCFKANLQIANKIKTNRTSRHLKFQVPITSRS